MSPTGYGSANVEVTEFDCVRERVARWTFEHPLTPDGEVWHVAPQRGRTEDFCPIRCSADEGITFPGHVHRREPTCPDCRAAVGLDSGTGDA